LAQSQSLQQTARKDHDWYSSSPKWIKLLLQRYEQFAPPQHLVFQVRVVRHHRVGAVDIGVVVEAPEWTSHHPRRVEKPGPQVVQHNSVADCNADSIDRFADAVDDVGAGLLRVSLCMIRLLDYSPRRCSATPGSASERGRLRSPGRPHRGQCASQRSPPSACAPGLGRRAHPPAA
jgi:hypothetical protein